MLLALNITIQSQTAYLQEGYRLNKKFLFKIVLRDFMAITGEKIFEFTFLNLITLIFQNQY